MTFYELFSKRYKLRPTPEGLIEQNVPHSARVGLTYILDDLYDRNYTTPDEIYKNMCIALRVPRTTRDDILQKHTTVIAECIESDIEELEWWQFYDICEVISEVVRSRYQYYDNEFTKKLNDLFVDEELPFQLKNGKVEKVGSGFIDVNIKEVRVLLREPEFKSADELFGKAIKALNERPKPDKENCIKDSVAAIESIGKIITNNEKTKLDDIINDAVRNGVIPQLLGQTIMKLHAYRGNEPAVAHGGTEPSKVTEDEAEFVLAMSAAIIIYLVKKRSLL